VEFHKSHGKLLTMSVVKIPSRFGVIKMDENGNVKSFSEKNADDGTLINAGYMVCDPKVLDYIEGDETAFEKEPLENIAKDGQLVAYKHDGFWQCMDTMREKDYLENLWKNNDAKWKVWND
ncbi:MAG: glucose-1-phosphate cytidylyltransferase, partial [Clostridia bacterium]|nr:glucose-1-phosphate cytidylyltransferase [Clostridia bacterium]